MLYYCRLLIGLRMKVSLVLWFLIDLMLMKCVMYFGCVFILMLVYGLSESRWLLNIMW